MNDSCSSVFSFMVLLLTFSAILWFCWKLLHQMMFVPSLVLVFSQAHCIKTLSESGEVIITIT